MKTENDIGKKNHESIFSYFLAGFLEHYNSRVPRLSSKIPVAEKQTHIRTSAFWCRGPSKLEEQGVWLATFLESLPHADTSRPL